MPLTRARVNGTEQPGGVVVGDGGVGEGGGGGGVRVRLKKWSREMWGWLVSEQICGTVSGLDVITGSVAMQLVLQHEPGLLELTSTPASQVSLKLTWSTPSPQQVMGTLR